MQLIFVTLHTLSQKMYNLALHIEYLLLRHDCVVVPGVGAFINIRHSAFYDKTRKSWMPMTREIRFNSALRHDDGLLASSYARKNRLPFQEGRDLLRNDIDQLTQLLHEDGEVTLGHLGVLQKSEDTLQYIPLYSPAQSASMLGYHEVHESKADAQLKIESLVTEVQPETTSESQSGLSIIGEKENIKRFNTDRNYYIPVNKVFARVAACLVIVVLAGVAMLLPADDRQKIDRASVLPIERIMTVSTDSGDKQTLKTPSSHQVDDVKVRPASPVEEMNKEGSLRYHAIVATFNTSEEADKFIAANTASGYELYKIVTPTKTRVSAAGCATSSEAYQIISSPEFHKQFSQSWVWEAPEK